MGILGKFFGKAKQEISANHLNTQSELLNKKNIISEVNEVSGVNESDEIEHKRLEERVISVYKQFQMEYDKSPNFRHIPNCYESLFLKNDIQVKTKTIDMINEKLQNATNKDLINYDKTFRQKTSLDWYRYWKETNLEDLINSARNEDELINLLGLSTFHPNGFYREKALKRLIQIKNRRIFPFVVIRLNDWVGVIQNIAKDYIDSCITKDSIEDYIYYLELLKHTEYYSRLVNNDVMLKIQRVLSEKEVQEKLIINIDKYNDFVKVHLYNEIKNSGHYRVDYVFELLLKEKSKYVQNKVLYDFVSELDDSFFEENLLNLQNCKANKVKLITIVRQYNQLGVKSIEDLRWGLVDNALDVRDLSRVFLRKVGVCNFNEFYIEIMKTGEVVGVLGLCEVASVNDFDLIYNELYKHSTRVSKIIIKTLAKLDYKRFEDDIYKNLESNIKSFSNVAKEILVNDKNKIDEEKTLKIFNETTVDYIKINCLLVLLSLSKWKSIYYILELLNLEDEVLLDIVKSKKSMWFSSMYSSYTKPTTFELERLKNVYNSNSHFLDKNENFTLEKLIKYFED